MYRIESICLTKERFLNLFSIKFHKGTRYGNWLMSSRREEPLCVTGDIRPDAVVIAAYHKEKDSLVLTREYRVVIGGYELGFPAGLIDKGETAEQAAIREFKEETGLDVTKVLKISPIIYASTGMTDECAQIVYVECSGEFSNEGNTDMEDITTEFYTRDKIKSLEGNWGAKAWLIADRFAETGKIV